MRCPRTAQRTEAYRPSVSLLWQAVGKHSILKDWQRFFLPLQSASHLARAMPAATLTRSLRRALGKEGIMHATLSPSWKKSLLLVFVSVVAFATATPATSSPQCFFQGLGFLPGGHQSSPSGVSANGTVVVGSAIDASFHTQAFCWSAASALVALGFLPGFRNFSGASGVNANVMVVVGSAGDASHSQAFRWTAASGMVGLGFLPGGNQSLASGVNANGKVVVGSA